MLTEQIELTSSPHSPPSSPQARILQDRNWEPDWIKTAQDLVHDEYNKTYAPRGDPVDHLDGPDPVTVSVSVCPNRTLRVLQELASNIFAHLSVY